MDWCACAVHVGLAVDLLGHRRAGKALAPPYGHAPIGASSVPDGGSANPGQLCHAPDFGQRRQLVAQPVGTGRKLDRDDGRKLLVFRAFSRVRACGCLVQRPARRAHRNDHHEPRAHGQGLSGRAVPPGPRVDDLSAHPSDHLGRRARAEPPGGASGPGPYLASAIARLALVAGPWDGGRDPGQALAPAHALPVGADGLERSGLGQRSGRAGSTV